MKADAHVLFVPNYGLSRFEDHYTLAGSEVDTINGLTEAGINVTVFAFCARVAIDFPGRALREDDRLRIQFVDSEPDAGMFKKVTNYVRFLRELVSTISSDDKLLYIYYPGTVALLTSFAACILNKPFALYVRGDWKYRFDFRLFSNFVFSRADFVIATGAGFVDEIRGFCRAAEPVVPMLAFDAEETVERSYELEGPLKALFVGRILEEKGVLDAVKSIAELRRAGLEATLTIVGGGTPRDKDLLINEIESTGLVDHVKYLGHVTDFPRLKAIFSRCDVFVFPSYYAEGFPRVVYEAMVYAMPIICTILPGMRGFMSDGRNCIAVPEQNVSALRDSLIKLCLDPKLRSRLGLQAKEDVLSYLSRFHVSNHAEQIIAAASQNHPSWRHRTG